MSRDLSEIILYVDLVLQKHCYQLLLSSVLKTVLLNIFGETVLFPDSLMNSMIKSYFKNIL